MAEALELLSDDQDERTDAGYSIAQHCGDDIAAQIARADWHLQIAADERRAAQLQANNLRAQADALIARAQKAEQAGEGAAAWHEQAVQTWAVDNATTKALGNTIQLSRAGRRTGRTGAEAGGRTDRPGDVALGDSLIPACTRDNLRGPRAPMRRQPSLVAEGRAGPGSETAMFDFNIYQLQEQIAEVKGRMFSSEFIGTYPIIEVKFGNDRIQIIGASGEAGLETVRAIRAVCDTLLAEVASHA